MSMAETLRLARAVTTGVSQRRRLYRHVHLTDAPLLVSLTFLAGEPVGAFAVAARRRGEQPCTWIIAEPRDRDLRDRELAAFHRWFLAEVDRDQHDGRTTQLIVPNPAEADALARLGRLHRYQRRNGKQYPAEAVTGAQLLTFLTGRRELPGSALCLDATTELQRIWSPPLSGPECAHLGALVAAIDPPPGMRAQHAAEAAEHTAMGLVPDPSLDNEVLLPVLQRFNAARNNGAGSATVQECQAALTEVGNSLVAPKLFALTCAVELLSAVPETPSAATRFFGTGRFDHAVPADTAALAWQLKRIQAGEPRFSKVLPSHLQAAHLARAEATQQVMDAWELYEDPAAFADAVADGRAWVGQITNRDYDHRTIPPGRTNLVRRPQMTAQSPWPMRYPVGTRLRWAEDPEHVVLDVLDVQTDGDTSKVQLQVTEGMKCWPSTNSISQLRVADASPAEPSRPPDIDPKLQRGGRDA